MTSPCNRIREDIKNAEKIVSACIAPHNYLIQANCAKCSPSEFVDCEVKNHY